MRKNGIILELTALLDVILILLFMVMQGASGQAEAAGEAAAAAQAAQRTAEEKAAQTEKDADVARNALKGFQALADNCKVLSIHIDNISDTSRVIYLSEDTTDGEVELAQVQCDAENPTYTKNALNAAMKQYADVSDGEQQMVLFVFRYDSRSIYRYEYDIVDKLLTEYSRSENVYSAQYDVTQ